MNFFMRLMMQIRGMILVCLLCISCFSLLLGSPEGHRKKCFCDATKKISLKVKEEGKLQQAVDDSSKQVASSITVDAEIIYTWIKKEAPHLLPDAVDRLVEEKMKDFRSWLQTSGIKELASIASKNAQEKLEVAISEQSQNFKLKGFGLYEFNKGNFSQGSWSKESIGMTFEDTSSISVTFKAEVECNLSPPIIGGAELKLQIKAGGKASISYTKIEGLEKIPQSTNAIVRGRPQGKVSAKTDLELQMGMSSETGIEIEKTFTQPVEIIELKAIESEAQCP